MGGCVKDIIKANFTMKEIKWKHAVFVVWDAMACGKTEGLKVCKNIAKKRALGC